MANENDESFTFVEANGGKLYMQTAPGRFMAVDAEKGAVLWSFQGEDLRFFTKAAFGADALFVAATGAGNSHSELIRFDLSSGKADWHVQIAGLGGNGSPVLCGREVLLGNYWNKTVSAFNTETGKNDWKTESLPFLFLFPPAVLDNKAFFLIADRKEPESKQQLMVVSCGDGQPSKTLQVHVDGVSRTPVLLYKESVVLSGYDKARGTSLAAIRLNDGTQLWSALIPDEIARFSPTIQNNLLIAGAASLWVVDLDTGKVDFHEELPRPTLPVAAVNGMAVYSCGSQTIEALELPSGTPRWRTKLRGKINSNIAIMDSHIYVKTGDSQLAVLRMTGEVDRYLQIATPGERPAASH